MYTVESDDPRPKRLDQKIPPTNLESERQATTQDYEDGSYIAAPPDEPRPGPLHPGKPRKNSKNGGSNKE
ncbi:hypothetical protein [Methanolobus halotolerans]|uniref:hypothetical protein n=1 Tax=Methanolobus halotolerans TaxID=2052935 RepID=UPI00107F346E|nr:hypothetical protein [Methanolobus halotolerans]